MQLQRGAKIRTTEATRQRNAAVISNSPLLAPLHPALQLQQTIGNQGVQRLLRSRAVQAKLRISEPGDVYEQEADRVAEEVMRMPAPAVQRACAPCAAGGPPRPKCEDETKGLVQPVVSRVEPRKTEQASDTTGVPNNFLQNLGPGQPLDASTRAFMEPCFGHDFGHVRVHTDAQAAESARAVNALAFTVGRDVVFGPGQYAPATQRGRALLAHELTHVVQQNQRIATAKIQRQCSDPDFCTPYATTAEAVSEESWLRTYFLPAMELKFGTEVHDLWESFLSRTPGASLTRRVFDTPGDPVEDSFATSSAVEEDQEAVLDSVVSRLSRFPGGRLSPHTHTVASLANFLSASEMNDRPINFSNPLSIAGNIAGGIGSSAAGPDFRKIARANVVLEKIPLIGNSGYIYFELVPFYEVYDAVDLCPGQCGSPAEQIFTIPLSRLEAMGRAFDVPYVVKFQPEHETRREFYANLPL